MRASVCLLCCSYHTNAATQNFSPAHSAIRRHPGCQPAEIFVCPQIVAWGVIGRRSSWSGTTQNGSTTSRSSLPQQSKTHLDTLCTGWRQTVLHVFLPKHTKDLIETVTSATSVCMRLASELPSTASFSTVRARAICSGNSLTHDSSEMPRWEVRACRMSPATWTLSDMIVTDEPVPLASACHLET